MDKFSSLLAQLEEIISRLDKEIENQENNLSKIEDSIVEMTDKKRKTERSIKRLQSKLDVLKQYENKNVWLTAIIEILADKETYELYKSLDKNKKIIILLILVAAILLIPYSIVLVSYMLLIIMIIVVNKVNYVKKLKKTNSIPELETRLSKLAETWDRLISDEIELQRQKTEIEEGKQQLAAEKESYKADLTKVEQERTAAIERIFFTVLDQEYEDQNFIDIIRRVREIQKKEGKK